MTSLSEGDRYYDPHTDREFTVLEDVDTFGMDVREMDRLSVRIQFDDGETYSVPHERFRGRATYERVGGAEA